ncbi:MAG TPA: TA system VapC family ribonuclease toxin [Terriglobia bacterium]|nr:TA system VapC family ribonuclease toxin [Terriglobia bacterium]
MDTNLLIYARRQEPAEHELALRLLRELSTGAEPWAIPWPCVYEFIRVVTHPRVFHPPTPVQEAWEAMKLLMDSPSVVVLSEGDRHRAILDDLLASSPVTGNLVHDAHIAALLIEHGVQEILTNDDDFRRFPKLRVTNPFRSRGAR